MIEIFIAALFIIFIISVLPYAVYAGTKSELKDQAFRELFYKEAGYRGVRIICTSVSFTFPTALFKQPITTEGAILSAMVFCYCCYESLKLYKGVKIFSRKNIQILGAIALLMAFLRLLNGLNVIEDYLLVLLSGLAGLTWGWRVNLTRCKELTKEQGS